MYCFMVYDNAISGGMEEKQRVIWGYKPSCAQMQTANGGSGPSFGGGCKRNGVAARGACNPLTLNGGKKLPSI